MLFSERLISQLRRRPFLIAAIGAALVLGIACVWLAWSIDRAKRQGEAVQTALRLGASVEFDFYFLNGDPEGQRVPRSEPPAPLWLRRLFGDDLFRNVVGLTPQGQAWQDDDLAILWDLPRLQKLSLYQAPRLGDPSLAHVSACRRLRLLHLERLPLVTDAGLANLRGLNRLREVHLTFLEGISDAGINHLLALPNLEVLDLTGTGVTDTGFTKLKSLPQLKRVWAYYTQVTPAGAAALRRAIPGIEIRIGSPRRGP